MKFDNVKRFSLLIETGEFLLTADHKNIKLVDGEGKDIKIYHCAVIFNPREAPLLELQILKEEALQITTNSMTIFEEIPMITFKIPLIITLEEQERQEATVERLLELPGQGA